MVWTAAFPAKYVVYRAPEAGAVCQVNLISEMLDGLRKSTCHLAFPGEGIVWTLTAPSPSAVLSAV